MKYLKKEEKQSKLPLILGIVAAFLALVVICMLFMISRQATPGEGSGNTDATNIADMNPLEIQTPYGNLCLDENWEPYLRYEVTQGADIKLAFSAEIAGTNVKLYDLYLGSEEGLAGHLTADSGEKIPVGAVVYDILPVDTWTAEEEELAFAMRDTLNDFLLQLKVESVQDEPESPDEEAVEKRIETAFGTFTYMDFWDGGLRIQVKDDSISGFGTVPGKTEQSLFEISVGGTGEDAVGMYTDKDGKYAPVYLTVVEPTFDASWTEEEQRMLYGMQNVLNDFLEQMHLSEPEQQAANIEETNEDVSVETPYGVISYPGRYEENLRIVQDDSDGYCLSVYAEMPEKKELHLFDIMVDMNGDLFAGTLTDEDGNKKEVFLNVPTLTLGEEWTDEERAEVFLMQELLNDFCAQLAVSSEVTGGEKEETSEGSNEDVLIQTPYGTLRYPGEYSSALMTEVTDNAVRFFAVLNSSDPLWLFDIVFGGSGDACLGIHVGEDGRTLDVYITSNEIMSVEDWNADEIQTIYGMQEASNYVIVKMEDSGILMP